jgi:hypothetical protein
VPLVAILALIALAAAISELQFGSGFRIEAPKDSSTPPQSSDSQTIIVSPGSDFGKELLVILIWGLLVAAIFSMILWPENLRETLKRAIATAVWIAAIYFLYRRFREQGAEENATLGSESSQPSVNPNDLIPNWNEMQVPLWFIFSLLLGVGGVIIVCILLVRRLWIARQAQALWGDFADLAGQAARELRGGAGLRDVVLRCYHEMSVLLAERKKIHISQSMTAREFENNLITVGIQDTHVHRLTQLFESVRYGRNQPTATEESEAIACLEAISRSYRPTS